MRVYRRSWLEDAAMDDGFVELSVFALALLFVLAVTVAF
jgi:hypothetical protein